MGLFIYDDREKDAMKALSIMYHDVVQNGDYMASGFPGENAHIYKLQREDFDRHLVAIREAIWEKPIQPVDQLRQLSTDCPVFLTFDDGGVSAYDCVAGMLEAYGWRGHFFIATDWIGRPGFLNKAQIRDLRKR